MPRQRSKRRDKSQTRLLNLEVKGSSVRNRTPPRRGRWRKSESLLEGESELRASRIFAPGSLSKRLEYTEQLEDSKHADTPINILDPPSRQELNFRTNEDEDFQDEDTKISDASRRHRPTTACKPDIPDLPVESHASPHELNPDQELRASLACPSFPSNRNTKTKTPTQPSFFSPHSGTLLEDPVASLSPNKTIRASTILCVGEAGRKQRNAELCLNRSSTEVVTSQLELATPRSPLFDNCEATRSSIAPSPGLPQGRTRERKSLNLFVYESSRALQMVLI